MRRKKKKFNEQDIKFKQLREPTWWEKKQAFAKPSRYYGDGGTIHSTNHLDIEVRNGEVVAVWFRCQMLPFRQHEADGFVGEGNPDIKITGVEILD